MNVSSRLPRLALLLLSLVAVLTAGCPRNEPPPPPPPADTGKPIRLLVIDDPALAAAVERTWRSRSEAPLEVRQQSAPDLENASRLDADAVIYPSGLLGGLAERGLLFPLTSQMQDEPELQEQEVFDMLRLREVRWGEQTYAVSFGSPVVLLAYRADLLERLELAPPATWADYHRAAARLHEIAGSEGATPAAAVEPCGTDWAGLMFLARSASYARHRDQYSDVFDFTDLKPLIDAPPFVRALEEMIAASEYGSPEAIKYSPHDAFREVADGRAAMALAWPPTRLYASKTEEAAAAADNGPQAPSPVIRWAELPGSPDVYHVSAGSWEKRESDEPQRVPLLAAAGRLGSVTRESNRSKAALHVLAILSAEESRNVVAASPATTLYRESHLAAPAEWYPASGNDDEAASYAEAAEQSLSRGVWMFSPRIPGRERYLAALDGAVRKALSQELPAQEALAQAAKEWDAITEELGREKQLAAYRRSLGLEP